MSVRMNPPGSNKVTIKAGELFCVENGYINTPALRDALGYEFALDEFEAKLAADDRRLTRVVEAQLATMEVVDELRHELAEYKALYAELVEMLASHHART